MPRNPSSFQAFSFFLIGIPIGFIATIYPAHAGDHESTRMLISFVSNPKVEKWNEAPNLYASISGNSTFKPVAAQAMALIHIRQRNYSDAWKLLNAQSSHLSSASLAYRLGHEKLMLWLWLQAGSAAQAEAQFNRLVTIALDQELPDPERQDVCLFLGSIGGMMQSAGDPVIVAAATLESARESLEGHQSKTIVEPFRRGFESTNKWYQDVHSKLDAYSRANPKEANNLLDAFHQELERVVGERVTRADEIKAQQSDKKLLDTEMRNLRKNQNWLIAAWNTPTRGFPPIPVKPRFRSSVEPKYETIHITDPTTGERTTKREKIPLSSSEKRKYESDWADYQKSLSRYELAVQSYPARVAEWRRADAIRRANLKERKKLIDEAISNKKSSIDDLEKKIKGNISSSKALESDIRLSEEIIAIASSAKQREELGASVLASIARPSHFPLLNFESEVFRLEKCLRDIAK
jgi:hypothetical protein